MKRMRWVGLDGENSFSDLDPAQRRQTDVQQNQIGLERLCLLNGFGAVGGFTDNFPFRQLLAERREHGVATVRSRLRLAHGVSIP